MGRPDDRSPSEETSCCWICLCEDEDDDIVVHLGCPCVRKVHLHCAARWYFSKIAVVATSDIMIMGSSIAYTCICETCQRPIPDAKVKMLSDFIFKAMHIAGLRPADTAGGDIHGGLRWIDSAGWAPHDGLQRPGSTPQFPVMGSRSLAPGDPSDRVPPQHRHAAEPTRFVSPLYVAYANHAARLFEDPDDQHTRTRDAGIEPSPQEGPGGGIPPLPPPSNSNSRHSHFYIRITHMVFNIHRDHRLPRGFLQEQTLKPEGTTEVLESEI